MKYSKPEAMLVESSIAAVQNTSQSKGGGSFLDTPDLPAQHYINTKAAPAYEADE